MTPIAGFTKRDVISLWCKSNMMNYTQYFFQKQYGRSFVVGEHHVKIAKALDDVLMGRIRRLIINIAPRYGKTELAVKNFISAGLAINPAAKFIHLSYSDDLALDNSEAVKDLVTSEAYQQLFPDVQLKASATAKNKWYTTQGGGVYARAAGGQVTGFGAGQVDEEPSEEQLQDDVLSFDEMLALGDQTTFGGALIIDDPIKPDDADSDTVRGRVNNRFDSTIINRVNSRNTPIIIIMQRLHENDLCGHVLEHYPGEWTVLSLPCIIVEEGQELEEGRALWEFKHTLNELLQMNSINPINFGRQYMQNPQPKEGLMYNEFKLYGVLPNGKVYRKSYTDTADEGKDYLCSIAYIEDEVGIYLLDVIYSQAPMEITEPLTAQQLAFNKVQFSKIESNNGGRGFARNVEAELTKMKHFSTEVSWFHQSDNKASRIFSNSNKVNQLVHMPVGWEKMWPVFHKHITAYSKKGKNAHDDGPDALTGCVENFGNVFKEVDDSIFDLF